MGFKKEAQTHQFSQCIYVQHIDTDTPSVSKMWWANNGNNFEFEFRMDTRVWFQNGRLTIREKNVRVFFFLCVAVWWNAIFLRFRCNVGHQWWIPLRRDFLLVSTSTKQTNMRHGNSGTSWVLSPLNGTLFLCVWDWERRMDMEEGLSTHGKHLSMSSYGPFFWVK